MNAAQAYGVAPPGFRLPADTSVGTVRLQVSDLARSRDFYEGVLGLDATPVGAGRLDLRVPGSADTLIELHGRPGATPVPRRGAYGLYHFAVLLPSREDLGRFVAHIVQNGVRVGAADHLVSEAIYLTDPDGLGIEVYSDRPRDSWRVRDGQLAMATDPLDLASLVAAAGQTRWAGAPAGTVMGHVHLHVGSIDGAEAYYHRAIGLDKMVWSYPGALFLSAGGYHHHLGTNTWSPGPSAADDQARLLEWEMRLPSQDALEDAARSLADGGYSGERDDQRLRTSDPWGTRLSLVAP
jgi:catechol 2,3-dioxygenase